MAANSSAILHAFDGHKTQRLAIREGWSMPAARSAEYCVSQDIRCELKRAFSGVMVRGCEDLSFEKLFDSWLSNRRLPGLTYCLAGAG